MDRKSIISLIYMLFVLSNLFSQNYRLLVGTYTRETSSEGIYALEIDKKGNLISKKLLAKSDNPSFLAFSPDKRYLYTVNEIGNTSFVSAFSFDETKQELTFLNKTEVEGDPCHITCTDNHVFTANYSAGSIAVFEREADGSLSNAVQVITHPRVLFGRGRTGPGNAHQIIPSPNGKFMMATNLGTDRVFTYRYNAKSNTEVLTYVDDLKVNRGSGPRHMTFSKDGKYLYLLNELNASLVVFSVAESGSLSIIQETTLVTDLTLKNGAADIHLTPDGKFLYATNRGESNTITAFRVNTDGTLKWVKQYPTYGNPPRNIATSPDGKFIFVGNQRTNNITVFQKKICGKLKLINKDIELGAPVCLLFY
ncbi:MAG: lactonase family protein [Paludibacteraceae bacterium]